VPLEQCVEGLEGAGGLCASTLNNCSTADWGGAAVTPGGQGAGSRYQGAGHLPASERAAALQVSALVCVQQVTAWSCRRQLRTSVQ
jgi:hypothetical protein